LRTSSITIVTATAQATNVERTIVVARNAELLLTVVTLDAAVRTDSLYTLHDE